MEVTPVLPFFKAVNGAFRQETDAEEAIDLQPVAYWIHSIRLRPGVDTQGALASS
ncbi:hypothetical protein [Spirosoma sp. 209]|uniref:hypothetical protein n=1 Tax=Spirosoma sp. 209 TaxID=1955701 RepID=UPI001374818B|nr:hypothetical protein [Spirosoma sp. 209]